jgi:hypothetical protein
MRKTLSVEKKAKLAQYERDVAAWVAKHGPIPLVPVQQLRLTAGRLGSVRESGFSGSVLGDAGHDAPTREVLVETLQIKPMLSGERSGSAGATGYILSNG